MKIAISVPDPLFREGEAAAKIRGVSRSELYATALAEFLEQHESRRVTERLNEVYSKAAAKVDTALNRMQLAALPDEEW